MVPNSHMDTYACELECSYTETVGNGRMDGPSGVRSHPPTPTRLLILKYRVRTGTRRAAPRRRDRKYRTFKFSFQVRIRHRYFLKNNLDSTSGPQSYAPR